MRMTETLIGTLIVTIFAVSTIANASDVRRSELPEIVWGTWASSVNACSGSDPSKIDIYAKKHSSEKLVCDIDWVTVTATPKGPNYSTRSRCVDRSTQEAVPPVNLLIRPIDGSHILLGQNEDSFRTYRRCP